MDHSHSRSRRRYARFTLVAVALSGCTAQNPDFVPGLEVDGGARPVDFAGAPPPDFAGTIRDFALPRLPDLALPPPPPRVVLVPTGATWRYLDDGSNQGAAWQAPAFDDSKWRSGPAELGYGDGDERTMVGFGPDRNRKYVTTYFRTAFEARDVMRARQLDLRFRRDDGIIIYLNGVEILRNNMPGGMVDYRTLASEALGEPDEDDWPQAMVDPHRLVEGKNVIAAEVHQAAQESTDISFDLELVVYYR